MVAGYRGHRQASSPALYHTAPARETNLKACAPGILTWFLPRVNSGSFKQTVPIRCTQCLSHLSHRGRSLRTIMLPPPTVTLTQYDTIIKCYSAQSYNNTRARTTTHWKNKEELSEHLRKLSKFQKFQDKTQVCIEYDWVRDWRKKWPLTCVVVDVVKKMKRK